MNETLPLVSVVIPVYNGSNYLKQAIDSVLNQTYPNIEIIVVNDGSTDGGATAQIAKSYGNRIQYYEKENGGVSSALNLGVCKMKGEYFSWLSHDDLYRPRKIELQVETMQRFNKDRLVCLCGSRAIDKNSKLLTTKKRNLFTPNVITTWKESLKNLLIYGTFQGCGFLLPKEVFKTCGKFNENLRYCQDTLMWMNVFLEKYDLIFVDYVGVWGRIHSGQVTLNRKDLFEKDALYISKTKFEELTRASERKYNFVYMQARRMAIRGQAACVNLYIQRGKDNGMVSKIMALKLKVILLYGRIRPFIAKLYRKFLRI